MNIKNRMVKTTAIAFMLILSTAQGHCAEFYVAPGGEDGNAGTKAKPFASLAGARNAVRKLLAEGLTQNVTILIREGTYELSGTLMFEPGDSGTDKQSITYAAFPGETAVVSGGREIKGWRRSEGDIWLVKLPASQEGKWHFRQLWVNGRRAKRARTPNRDSQAPYLRLKGATLSEDEKTCTYTFAPDQLKNWQNLSDVEAVVFGHWAITRKRFQRLDPRSGVTQMAGPHGAAHACIAPAAGRTCYVENVFEGLDQPGEWYLDRQTGVLSYWSRPGENMATAKVVAPALTQLLRVEGTPKQPVRNLHFRGIQFLYTDWSPPEGGYVGDQACFFSNIKKEEGILPHIDTAIHWDYVESSSVSDSVIARLGGGGIALLKGCHRNTISGNYIFDISANGVMLGGQKEEDPDAPKDNRIANNHIHACGIDFYGAVGIWVGIAQRALISRNRVHDLPYSGISVGWQWHPDPSSCRENTVEHNHIFDVMKRLADGGGIYTLGAQAGTVIRGNHIHDVHRSPYAEGGPNNGIFADQGSRGYLFEQNVIYNTAGEPVRFNQGSRDLHQWDSNFFAVSGKAGSVPAPELEYHYYDGEKPSSFPPVARNVISIAGLEPTYRKRLLPQPRTDKP